MIDSSTLCSEEEEDRAPLWILGQASFQTPGSGLGWLSLMGRGSLDRSEYRGQDHGSLKRTVKCSAHAHLDFEIECEDSVPRVDVDWLVQFLEEQVSDGEQYEHGETMELGSSILLVEKQGSYLTLSEPDFRSIPIEWVSGVTNSLTLLRLQKDSADSFGLLGEIEFAGIRQSLIVGSDLNISHSEFVLERTKSQPPDSGWFIGALDSELDYQLPQNLQRVSVFEAMSKWPQIRQFLALPEGCRVEIAEENFHGQRNGVVLVPQTGSLLARGDGA